MTTRIPTTPASTSTSVRCWEDRVQRTADVLALIPIVNIPASIVSGVISLRKRDYTGAALSALGLIPFEGEGATLIKLARDAAHVHHVVKTGTCAVKAARQRVSTSARPSALPTEFRCRLLTQRSWWSEQSGGSVRPACSTQSCRCFNVYNKGGRPTWSRQQ